MCKPISEPEVYARLTALHTALVEKLGGQPWLTPALTIDADCRIHIYEKRDHHGGECIYSARADTIAACLAKAEAFVALLPDREAKTKADWHRKLGDVIDEGHALALPDEVMAPLRQGSQAMTENLLPAPAEGAPA